MELLQKQIAQAENRGEYCFVEILEEIQKDAKNDRDQAIRAANNVIFLDDDF